MYWKNTTSQLSRRIDVFYRSCQDAYLPQLCAIPLAQRHKQSIGFPSLHGSLVRPFGQREQISIQIVKQKPQSCRSERILTVSRYSVIFRPYDSFCLLIFYSSACSARLFVPSQFFRLFLYSVFQFYFSSSSLILVQFSLFSLKGLLSVLIVQDAGLCQVLTLCCLPCRFRCIQDRTTKNRLQ